MVHASRGQWHRVSRARRCPICDKPDWCMFTGTADAPTAVICARTESSHRAGEAGWVHRLRDDGTFRPARQRGASIAAPPPPRADLARFAEWCAATVDPIALTRFADSLGLTVASLRRLLVGRSPRHRAWTFPMRDAAGNVTGIRLRRPDGRKLSFRGGREGLFMPDGLTADGPLYIAEGPTDTAALLGLSFAAVGRPSCRGGVEMLVDLVLARRPQSVVIVADNDSHDAGQRGAIDLACRLATYAPSVAIIAPPPGIKDAREWVRRGATGEDVLRAIANHGEAQR